MTREASFDCVILQAKTLGENNTLVKAMSQDEGVFCAVLYGGAKSKYRSLVSPFNFGKMWLSSSKQNQYPKVTDFEVHNFHISFATSLFKSMAALLAAEIVMKTNCAGDMKKAYFFFNGFLTGLDLATEEQGRLGLLRFLWRYINIMGLAPLCNMCSKCGAALEDAYFFDTTEGFLCPNCVPSLHNSFHLSKTALQYLIYAQEDDIKTARQRKLSKEDYIILHNLLFFMIEKCCNTKLLTLSHAEGIL